MNDARPKPSLILHRVLEAVASGLFIGLLAPAFGAAAFAAVLVVATDFMAGAPRTAGSSLLAALGLLSGAYILGAIPAFLAGSALPSLRRRLPALPAAAVTGGLGAVAYFATFGAHLLAEPHLLRSAWTFGLPAALGTGAAAFLYAIRRTDA